MPYPLLMRQRMPKSRLLHGEKSAGPQSEFLCIYMNVEVSVAAIMPYPLLAAADNPLVGLGQAQVKGNAFCSQVITYTAPVTGESRAGLEIT